MTDQQSDPLSAFISALVPLVPSPEVQEQIRRIFGAVGPGQNDMHMEHWNQGKTIQQSGFDVPSKHENEHAVGLYDKELRPALIAALFEWVKDHGADLSDRIVPKSTNRLFQIYQDYRIEGDPTVPRVEVYRPDFTLMRYWRYSVNEETGEPVGNPPLSVIYKTIDEDIAQRDGGDVEEPK